MLVSKINDPYYVILWSTDLSINLMCEIQELSGEFHTKALSKYKEIINTSFKMVEISSGDNINDIACLLDLLYEDWSDNITELSQIPYDVYEVFENKQSKGEIGDNWMEEADKLIVEKECEWLKSRYNIEFSNNTSMLYEYLAKEKDKIKSGNVSWYSNYLLTE